jgi:hypothetical protein
MARLMNRIGKVGTGRSVGGNDATDPGPAQLGVYRKTCYIRIEVNQAEPIVCDIVKRSCHASVRILNCGKSELNVQGSCDQIVTSARRMGYDLG